jgi:gliding motility-associated-like protein
LKNLLFAFLCLISILTKASHIVGGEMTYKYISKASNGDVTYTIKLSLYLDCKFGDPGAIQTDASGFINVFDAQTGSLLRNLSKTVNRQNAIRVSENAYKCIKNKPSLCVDLYVYETNVILPKRNSGYVITFERCCRNNTISNLTNPGTTGATYWTEIKPESSTGANSSPVFKSRPPVYLCLNAPFVFDHSATDSDGDSLVYELFTPYIGGSTNRPRPDYNGGASGTPVFPNANRLVKWQSPYSENDQMGGNPIMEQDPGTGRLTVTPTQSGQFVVGIMVKEFRNGVLIGETKRDYQFNVANCVFDVVSVFYTAKTNCTNSSVAFSNQSSGAVSYHWDFGVAGTNADTSATPSPIYNYSKPGTYKITLVARNAVCNDTFDYSVIIKQNIKTYLGRDTIFCNAANLSLDAGNPGKQFLWNTGQTTQVIQVSKTGKYMVSVTDAPCIAKDTISVIVDQTILDIGKDTTICQKVFQPYVYTFASNFVNYAWKGGSNTNFVNILKPEKYWLTITNSNGCVRADTLEVFQILPPIIGLRDTAVCLNAAANFDVGIPNYKYNWNTGEKSRSIQPTQPGKYWVEIDNNLCKAFDTVALNNIYPGLKLRSDTFFCGPFSYKVESNKQFANYRWSNGSDSSSTIASVGGNLSLSITSKEGCVEIDSLYLSAFPEIRAYILGDTVACTASIITLKTNDSMNYRWNTGSTESKIEVKEGGAYWVIITNKVGCEDSAYHLIRKNPLAFPNELYMANTFTPNGDLLNDVFPDNKFMDIQAFYELKIFNRWGELLFKADNSSNNWDGMYQGKPCQQDVYVYIVSYLGCDNSKHLAKGNFQILR